MRSKKIWLGSESIDLILKWKGLASIGLVLMAAALLQLLRVYVCLSWLPSIHEGVKNSTFLFFESKRYKIINIIVVLNDS